MPAFLPSLVLLCLFQAIFSQSTPSPTKNPECPEMHAAASHLEKAMTIITKGKADCRVNMHCSGMNCTGSRDGNNIFLRMELHHCTTPVTLHLDFKNGDKEFHSDMKDGDKKRIGTYSGADMYVTVHLHRDQNIVTVQLDLETCPFLGKLPCVPLKKLLEQSFCVSMRNCPGYQNNSTGTPPPCVPPTTSPFTQTGHSSPKRLHPSIASQDHSASTRSKATEEPDLPSTKKRGTGVPGIYGAHKHGRDHSASTRSKATEEPDHPSTKKGGKSSGLSVGTAVAIGFAGLVGLLIIVGVVVYWSKYHRRSRLRAAYYNDISMNDPLYEDFEPEVA